VRAVPGRCVGIAPVALASAWREAEHEKTRHFLRALIRERRVRHRDPFRRQQRPIVLAEIVVVSRIDLSS
jgi:hypothetical protein